MGKRMLAGVSPKELADLYRKAEKLGCAVSQAKGSTHIVVRLPGDLGELQGPLTGNYRSPMALRSRLRRHGLNI